MPLSREVALDWSYDASTGGAHPTRPRLAVGSPALLRRSLIRPRQVPPLAVLAALDAARHRHSRRGRRDGGVGRRPGRLGAPGRRLGRGDGLRLRPPGGVRPRRRARGATRRGGHRVLRDPRLVRAGAGRRPALRRRRRAARRPAPTCWPPRAAGRGLRARADGVLRAPTTRARSPRGWSGGCAARSPGGWCGRRRAVGRRRRGGHRAGARSRGPRRDRRQHDGPATPAWRCWRPRCAPAVRRCADPRPDDLEGTGSRGVRGRLRARTSQ